MVITHNQVWGGNIWYISTFFLSSTIYAFMDINFCFHFFNAKDLLSTIMLVLSYENIAWRIHGSPSYLRHNSDMWKDKCDIDVSSKEEFPHEKVFFQQLKESQVSRNLESNPSWIKHIKDCKFRDLTYLETM